MKVNAQKKQLIKKLYKKKIKTLMIKIVLILVKL